ncbi:MAG: hypothetical protein HFJ91_09895 [Muribaculaceae bacterium]|nr:hypothetical protein [Muribaculaceae bacterium]
MNAPLITWIIILGVSMTVLIANIIVACIRHNHNGHSLTGKADERELFYIPGDPDPHKTEYLDYYDYDGNDDF